MLKYLLFVVVVFSSCSSKNDASKDPVIFSEFPGNESVTFTDVLKFEYGAISRMFLRNTSLFVYSGNNMSSRVGFYAKTIYVYDWDGKPVKKINLDRYVTGLTVGNDDKTLYAYDVMSKFIVRAKIQDMKI